MNRRTDIRRDSKPSSPILFHDAESKARLEARNGLLQFDEVIRLVVEAMKSTAAFKLRPSTLQTLHRIAIQDIYKCAGNYRTHSVSIRGTTHQPPPWENVPQLVEEACDYVIDNWSRTAIHLAAYLMWRTNWIHPFSGGNGRTSRAVSYLVLCTKLGCRLPGTLTIPEQVVASREPYYLALDSADEASTRGLVDVNAMEELLSNILAKQLVNVYKNATK